MLKSKKIRLCAIVLDLVATIILASTVLAVHYRIDTKNGLIIINDREGMERGFLIAGISLFVVAFVLLLISEVMEK